MPGRSPPGTEAIVGVDESDRIGVVPDTLMSRYGLANAVGYPQQE